MPHTTHLRRIGSEMLAFALAASCPGCDEPETLLCPRCRDSLRTEPVALRTPGGLEVRAALRFEGVVARCIRRMKDQGETLLARPLGDAVGPLLDTVSSGTDDVRSALVVPVPTSRTAFRRRGYRVPEMLLRRAGIRPDRLLRITRRRGDQRGLDAAGRVDNVHGTLTAAPMDAGGCVVVFDDVVTTGATLDEASRALTAAGYHVVAGVALAATPRHSERIVNSSPTRSK